MMMAAKALLDENPDPSEEDVRWALSGNLCRCTGYQNIVKSVLWAADKLRPVPARGDDPPLHSPGGLPPEPDSPARGDTPAARPASPAKSGQGG
jgi:hypothetical protein